jgi:predicted phage-related endonuclease
MGSDIAAILGLHPYVTPLDVYLDKLGQSEDTPETDLMWLGRELEPVVARLVARKHPTWRVHPVHAMAWHWQEPFGANIDRLVYDRTRGWGVLELKTGTARTLDRWDRSGPPDYQVLQLQWYLMILRRPWGLLAALVGGEYREAVVEADPDLWADLHDAASTFWDRHVRTRIPPLADGSDRSTALLTALYPTAADTTVALPEDTLDLIAEYQAAETAYKAAHLRKQAAENQLKQRLGSAAAGTVGEWVVRWPTVTRTDLDTQRLKADHPDLYQAYTKTTTFRRWGGVTRCPTPTVEKGD